MRLIPKEVGCGFVECGCFHSIDTAYSIGNSHIISDESESESSTSSSSTATSSTTNEYTDDEALHSISDYERLIAAAVSVGKQSARWAL